jgi:hypothetical protein
VRDVGRRTCDTATEPRTRTPRSAGTLQIAGGAAEALVAALASVLVSALGSVLVSALVSVLGESSACISWDVSSSSRPLNTKL